jgi:hypothetical protein
MANLRFQVANYDQKFLLELGPRTEYILIQSDEGYNHTQDVASTVWVIPHNLGYYPTVQLIDSMGAMFDAQVAHVSINQLVVTISTAVAGTARLI